MRKENKKGVLIIWGNISMNIIEALFIFNYLL